MLAEVGITAYFGVYVYDCTYKYKDVHMMRTIPLDVILDNGRLLGYAGLCDEA